MNTGAGAGFFTSMFGYFMCIVAAFYGAFYVYFSAWGLTDAAAAIFAFTFAGMTANPNPYDKPVEALILDFFVSIFAIALLVMIMLCWVIPPDLFFAHRDPTKIRARPA